MNSQSWKPAAVSPSAKQHEPRLLSQPLSKRLLAYATVAGAGMATCASPARAEVVYNPIHRDIHLHYALDVNNDGIFDFALSSYQLSSLGRVTVKPVGIGNRVAAGDKVCFPRGAAAALPAGAEIGSGLFHKTGTCLATLSGYGSWYGVKQHYLALAFVVNGELHYGWARLSFNDFYCYTCIARIQGYAYETVANKPIRAGDEGKTDKAEIAPGSLGTLALGAPGVSLWRSEQP